MPGLRPLGSKTGYGVMRVIRQKVGLNDTKCVWSGASTRVWSRFANRPPETGLFRSLFAKRDHRHDYRRWARRVTKQKAGDIRVMRQNVSGCAWDYYPVVGVRCLFILSVRLGFGYRRLGSVVVEGWSSCLLVGFVFVVGHVSVEVC